MPAVVPKSVNSAPERASFLDLHFDRLSVAQVEGWLSRRSPDDAFAYVVTPNVDHVVRLSRTGDAVVRAAYEDADLCLCDSRVLARLAATRGVELTVVPGSDLVAALLGRVLRPGDRVCLIGGRAEHLGQLGARYPGLRFVQHLPPMGLREDAAARAAATAFAAGARARVVLLAVGAPQQEMLAREMKLSGDVRGTALCIGAGVDFLVGAQRRAPRLVQRLGFEWAWRLAGDPRRLARRYLVEGPAIFPLVWRWRRDR